MKLFRRQRWLRLGFMRLNFTPYCVAGAVVAVALGGLKTISEGILFLIYFFFHLPGRGGLLRKQPKPHYNPELELESARGC